MSKIFYQYPVTLPENRPFIEDLLNQLMLTVEDGFPTRGMTKENRTARINEIRVVAGNILHSLYLAYHSFPKAKSLVVIPLRTSHYTNVTGISHSTVKKVFEALVVLNWIWVKKGSELSGKATQVKAINDLAASFEQTGLVWAKQIPKPHKELVYVKNFSNPQGKNKRERGKSIPIEFVEDDFVFSSRDNLYAFNSFITQHCISISLEDSEIGLLKVKNNKDRESGDIDREAHVDLSAIQLRRVFSRGSFSKGGRFYGGWWQSIPSSLRSKLLIDGNWTIEVDYSSMALSCLLGLLGEKVGLDLDKDLYDIGLPDWCGSNDPRRKVVKRFINSFLNDDSGAFRLTKDELQIISMSKAELRTLVAAKYPEVEMHYRSGIGLNLQFIDSKIAEKVMLKMMQRNVVVLPVHDSFIVRLGMHHLLKEVMFESFYEIIGNSPRMTTESTVKVHSGDPSDGIVTVSDIEDSLFNSSQMEKYLGSWYSWNHGKNNY